MPGKFEIRKDKAGKFRFNLIAANGEIIASSEAYDSKEACKNGTQSVKTNALSADSRQIDVKARRIHSRPPIHSFFLSRLN